MNTKTLKTEQKTTIQIKAVKEPAFRARLLQAPKAVIEEELGIRFPDDLRIEVIEATKKNLLLLIPPKPDDFTEGMTAEQWLKKHHSASSARVENSVIQAQSRLFAKSWESDVFKQRLLRNPHGTIAQEFSVTLPEGFTITIYEETADHAIFVLPTFSNAEELSIEELEHYFGGHPVVAVVTIGLLGAASASSLIHSALVSGTVAGGITAGIANGW